MEQISLLFTSHSATPKFQPLGKLKYEMVEGNMCFVIIVRQVRTRGQCGRLTGSSSGASGRPRSLLQFLPGLSRWVGMLSLPSWLLSPPACSPEPRGDKRDWKKRVVAQLTYPPA